MPTDHQELLRAFKQDLHETNSFEMLFEHLPDVYFFVKDANYRLLTCNKANLALFRLKDASEIVGKSEYDFFPKKMADPIHADDVQVMENRRPIIDRVELIVNEHGNATWVSSTKLPMVKKDGTIAGLMGTTRILSHAENIPDTHRKFSKAMEHIRTHYNQPILVSELAKMCNLSASRFRHSFSIGYGMSPQKFILNLRIQMACQRLAHSKEDLIVIAQDCGFCDQSYFSRQFRKYTELTPQQYRTQYSADGSRRLTDRAFR